MRPFGKVLIDGDIVAYRAAFATQGKPESNAIDKTEDLMSYILSKTLVFPDPSSYTVYLTGKGNFRNEVAKTHVYKGNRKEIPNPDHLLIIRQYLQDKYQAVVSSGEEADDLIAIAATQYGKDTVVASIDKDMLQIPCNHYNFTKNQWTTVTEFEGTVFFYTQILTGDNVDNIKGLYGVGPVKASKMLEGCNDEFDLWKVVLKAYDGDYNRVVENARLLWLRREVGQIWEPPVPF